MFLVALNAQAQVELAEKMKNYMTVFSAGANSYLLGLIYTIVPIVGFWFLFEKKGEAGWKTLIPFYGTYIQYKLFFKTSKFWRLFIAGALLGVSFIMMLVGVALTYGKSTVPDSAGFTLLAAFGLMFICLIWILVISIQFDISICKKYGRGFWFTLGMIFITPIFVGILAYEVYKGRAKEV